MALWLFLKHFECPAVHITSYLLMISNENEVFACVAQRGDCVGFQHFCSLLHNHHRGLDLLQDTSVFGRPCRCHANDLRNTVKYENGRYWLILSIFRNLILTKSKTRVKKKNCQTMIKNPLKIFPGSRDYIYCRI